jgi:hypothetical protein
LNALMNEIQEIKNKKMTDKKEIEASSEARQKDSKKAFEAEV